MFCIMMRNERLAIFRITLLISASFLALLAFAVTSYLVSQFASVYVYV